MKEPDIGQMIRMIARETDQVLAENVQLQAEVAKWKGLYTETLLTLRKIRELTDET